MVITFPLFLKMESSADVTRKKKRVSKKKKISWIKHIDNKDVEEFLDQQRLEERLGSFAEKKDDELFVIDDDAVPQKKLSKKEKAKRPLKSLSSLVNNCPIPDPVGNRTRVKSREERKCRIRKSIEESQRIKGIIPLKTLRANQDRALTIRNKRKEPKEITFSKDIWADENKGVFVGKDTSWVGINTMKHHIGNSIISKPKDLTKRKSVVPAVEKPHPGTSYNPSLNDHKDLLKVVAEKEMEELKEEAHIKRCTSDIFKKVTIHQKEGPESEDEILDLKSTQCIKAILYGARWIEEMSQGLDKENDDSSEVPAGPLSVNPPTSFQNKKTLKQRRKQKEQKEAAMARKYAKVEKKKLADIYKLKFIKKGIESKEKREEIAAKIRAKQEELNVARTKRLSALKYVEPGMEFNRRCELRGNLRNIQKAGSLLSERFYSLQKRNILAPTAKVTRFRKAKVKVFTKNSHKIELPPTSLKKGKK